MARLQAYGFIDSFTNSLNPTIEGLQTKIKRWINAEVTSSQGPTDNMKCKSHAPFTARLGGRACSCARPAGVRVRMLPSPPARPAAVRMCVRPPGVRARAQAPARCPQGPLTSATLFAHLLPQPAAAAPLCCRGTGRRRRRGDGTRLAAACGGLARVLHRRLAPQADHTTSVPKKSIGLHKKSKTLPKKSKSCRKFQSVPTAFSSSTNVHSECSYPFGCTTERPPPPKNYFLSEPPNRGSGWACQKI